MQISTTTKKIDLEKDISTPVVTVTDSRVIIPIKANQLDSSLQESHDINVITLIVCVVMLFVLGGCSQLYKHEANMCYLFMSFLALSLPFVMNSTYKSKKAIEKSKF
jgi:hypothetical protein